MKPLDNPSILPRPRADGATRTLSNLSSVMFAPAASDLCIEFGIRDSTLATLTVTIYILGFAFGPLLISPLSEIYGRLPCYFIGNACWLVLTVGIAVSKNTATFMVLRVLAGIAASSPMTIGGGTIGDLYPVDKRGAAGAVFGMGPLIGPVSLSFLVTWKSSPIMPY